jgi:hypothetical protein
MKSYLVVVTILVAIGLVTGAYRAGYGQGKVSAQMSFQQAALAQRERENHLLLQLKMAKKERKIVYRERIKQVTEAKDGCLDRPVPESISRLLHDDGHSGTKPAVDTGL